MKRLLRALPAHFQVPFLGLLFFVTLCGYELLRPDDRLLWVLVMAAAALGTFFRPAAAAALGWVLVLALAAYLLVTAAVAPGSGASWLTLLIMPWLPPLTSNVAEYVRQQERRLSRQGEVLAEQRSLHPVTQLPGAGLAREFLPLLHASHLRSRHRGVLIELLVSNLAVIRALSTPEEADALLRHLAEQLRGSLRGNDWLFQVADDRLLLLADLGGAAAENLPNEVTQLYQDARTVLARSLGEPTASAADTRFPASGEGALLGKLLHTLRSFPRAELEVRSLLLPDHDALPDFDALLAQLAQQPARRLAAEEAVSVS